VATMAAHREHGGGRQGDTKPRGEGARGGGKGRRGRIGAHRGRANGGRDGMGRRGIVRGGLGKGEREGDLGGGGAGRWAPHGSPATAPTARAGRDACAGARRLGRRGRGAGRSWAAEPAKAGKGGPAGPQGSQPKRGKRGGPFLFSFSYFSHNSSLEYMIHKTLSIQTAKCMIQHDATTRENNSRFCLHKIPS
jgi:hypothetical protein